MHDDKEGNTLHNHCETPFLKLKIPLTQELLTSSLLSTAPNSPRHRISLYLSPLSNLFSLW